MTSAIPKLLTALGAAAFLFVAPVAAQDDSDAGGADSQAAGAADTQGGGPGHVIPSHEFDERVTPEHRTAMGTAFRGIADLPAAPAEVTFDPTPGTAIPATVQTYPVPDAIIEVTPDVRGYEYVTLPDGRIALVHPEERTIAVVLD